MITYFTTAGTVYYSIIPTKITITSPYLLFAKYDGCRFNNPLMGYTNEFLSNDFLTSLLTYVRTQKSDQELVQMLNMQTNSGLKTQTTLTFND